MAFNRTHIAKAGLALVLGVTIISASATPSAADPGAVAAGFIGGAALGALAGSAAAGAYGPPPGYYAPVVAPPPPCHTIVVRHWDPYAGVYVDVPRRVCDY